MQHETYLRQLPAGNRLAVIHVPGAPIFQIETLVNSGHRYTDAEHYELPHLLEHLAFEGTKNYPDATKYQFELERYGIYHNASTSHDRNAYVLYGAIEYWERITQFALDQLANPLFRDEDIAQEKLIITNELTSRISQADSMAGYRLHQLLSNDQPPEWSERIKTLDAISRDDILEFYQRLYQPANYIHIITGDLPEGRVDTIGQLIGAALAGQKKRPPVDAAPILPEEPKQSTHLLAYPHKESANFVLTFFQPGFHEMAYAPMRIFSTLLGHGMYARFHSKLRKSGLTYSTSSGYSSGAALSDYWVADKTQPQNIVPAIRLILDEIASVARGEFSDEEFERAIGYEVGSFATSFQTAISYSNWYSADYVSGLPLLPPEEALARLKAVQPKDIQHFATQHVQRSNPYRYLVAALPDQKIGAELDSLFSSFDI